MEMTMTPTTATPLTAVSLSFAAAWRSIPATGDLGARQRVAGVAGAPQADHNVAEKASPPRGRCR